METCCICGANTLLRPGIHHCSPRTLAKIENRRKRELKPEPPPTFDERLEVGFQMLDQLEFCNALP